MNRRQRRLSVEGIHNSWSSSAARAAFIESFSGKFVKPVWFDKIEFEQPPHDAQHPIATIFCGPHRARIKVLPDEAAIENFRRAYPHAKVVIIVVMQSDSPEDIRKTVFYEIESLLN